MAFKLITAPAALAVTLADAKANLRVMARISDAIITAWIEASPRTPKDTWAGRSSPKPGVWCWMIFPVRSSYPVRR